MKEHSQRLNKDVLQLTSTLKSLGLHTKKNSSKIRLLTQTPPPQQQLNHQSQLITMRI
jgi:hypothetical protein